MGKILKGNYKNQYGVIEKNLYLRYSESTFDIRRIKLDNRSVSKITELNKDEQKSLSSTIGRGAVGGMLLGPVGLLGGALSGKKKTTHLIKINFSDGKESIAEVDGKIFKQMIMHLNVE